MTPIGSSVKFHLTLSLANLFSTDSLAYLYSVLGDFELLVILV